MSVIYKGREISRHEYFDIVDEERTAPGGELSRRTVFRPGGYA